MRNLLKADLRRILKKRSFYIWLFLTSLFLFIGGGLSKYTSDTLNIERAMIKFAVPVIVSLNVYLSVFGDELKTGAIQCIIGRGISRTRVVMTKFLECLILSGILFAVVELVYFVRNIVFNVGASPLQSASLAFYIFMFYIRTMGYLAIASFFVYLTWSTAPGIIALVVLSSFIGLTLNLIETLLKVPVYQYYFDGLLDAAYAEISAGNVGYQIIPAVVIYIGGALFRAPVVFRKKEIEF